MKCLIAPVLLPFLPFYCQYFIISIDSHCRVEEIRLTKRLDENVIMFKYKQEPFFVSLFQSYWKSFWEANWNRIVWFIESHLWTSNAFRRVFGFETDSTDFREPIEICKQKTLIWLSKRVRKMTHACKWVVSFFESVKLWGKRKMMIQFNLIVYNHRLAL